MKTPLDKNLLERMYIKEHKSSWTIAKETGWSQRTIMRYLEKYAIKTRPYTENPIPLKKGDKMPQYQKDAISLGQKKMIERGERRYDGEHSPSWKGGPVKTPCLNPGCDNIVTVHKSRLKRAKHGVSCSKDCYRKWKSISMLGERVEYIDIACGHCGTSLHIYKSRLEENEWGEAFCDNTCSARWRKDRIRGGDHWNWKGGYEPYYGQDWQDQRIAALERDKHTCQVCFVHQEEFDESLTVHHIIPFRKFGRERYKEANNLDNLLSVCRPCHSEIEPRIR